MSYEPPPCSYTLFSQGCHHSGRVVSHGLIVKHIRKIARGNLYRVPLLVLRGRYKSRWLTNQGVWGGHCASFEASVCSWFIRARRMWRRVGHIKSTRWLFRLVIWYLWISTSVPPANLLNPVKNATIIWGKKSCLWKVLCSGHCDAYGSNFDPSCLLGNLEHNKHQVHLLADPVGDIWERILSFQSKKLIITQYIKIEMSLVPLVSSTNPWQAVDSGGKLDSHGVDLVTYNG